MRTDQPEDEQLDSDEKKFYFFFYFANKLVCFFFPLFCDSFDLLIFNTANLLDTGLFRQM